MAQNRCSIHTLHDRAEGCQVRPLYSTAFQSHAVPHPHVQFPKKLSPFLMISCLSQWAEVQVCLWLALAGLGQRNPALPSASPQVLWSAQTPGGAAGVLPNPEGFWKVLTPWLSILFSPFHLPKNCVFSACLHSDRTTSLWSWASPAVSFPPPLPLLHPTHGAAPAGQDWTSSICHRKKTFKEQTFQISLWTHRSQIPVPGKSHSPCDKAAAVREGLVKHLWAKGDFKEKRPGWRDCHHVLPWLTSVGLSAALCLLMWYAAHSLKSSTDCFWQSDQRLPKELPGNKASAQGTEECQQGGVRSMPRAAAWTSLTLCLSCCQLCLLGWELLHLSKNFWCLGGGISVCPVLWQQLLHSAVTGIHESHLSKWFCPQHSWHQRCEKQLQALELLYSLIWENVPKSHC